MTNNPWTWTHLCTCEVNISKNKQTKNKKTPKQSKPFWQLQENERIFFNDWFNQQEIVFFVLNSWFSGATKSLFNSQRSEESLTDRYFSIFLLRSFFFLFRLWLCAGVRAPKCEALSIFNQSIQIIAHLVFQQEPDVYRVPLKSHLNQQNRFFI